MRTFMPSESVPWMISLTCAGVGGVGQMCMMRYSSLAPVSVGKSSKTATWGEQRVPKFGRADVIIAYVDRFVDGDSRRKNVRQRAHELPKSGTDVTKWGEYDTTYATRVLQEGHLRSGGSMFSCTCPRPP